ncbi:zinc ribbon domain-containing protein [Butyrivibrio sp. VCB2006]|uniref:zinc ribbon domain-containing protein n=1 Tax=Butyrivibrio sp. VCB2006 TaxID=1280679 RepID=UPI00042557FB|nr:zinc ribbon domain-containing protein [Butyrivibrio sp. VCB2006]
MAFCKHCGAELKDGVAFCTKCGTKVDVTASAQKAQASSQTATTSKISNSGNMSVNNVKKGGFGKAIGIAVVSIAILLVVVSLGKKIGGGGAALDIKASTLYELDGYDGIGKLKASVDKETLKFAISEKNSSVSESTIRSFVNSIKVVPEATENLSEGQKVKVKVLYDTNAAKACKVKLKDTEWDYKVSGLIPVTEINPFDYVTVEFKGISPCGTLSFDTSYVDGSFGSLSYEFDKMNHLANGDVVTIKCTTDADRALKKGYKIVETTKQYTVDTLMEYITDPADLNDEILTKMKKEAEQIIDQHRTEMSAYHISCGEVKYEGAFGVTKKDYTDPLHMLQKDNYVVLVYSGTVSCTADPEDQYYFESEKEYIPVMFQYVIKNADGTLYYDKACSLKESVNLDTADTVGYGIVKFRGYKDGKDMFVDLVKKYQDYTEYGVDDSLSGIID